MLKTDCTDFFRQRKFALARIDDEQFLQLEDIDRRMHGTGDSWLIGVFDFVTSAAAVELAIREMTDAGKPTVVGAPDSRTADIYRSIARRIAVKIGEKAKDMTSKFPNIVVQNT